MIGQPQFQRGAFTLTEIMIVVAMIGLLTAIALPNYVEGRTNRQGNACIENLQRLTGAKFTWAVENKMVSSATPVDADLFGPMLYLRDKPECPAGGTYTLNRVRAKPVCSINGHAI